MLEKDVLLSKISIIKNCLQTIEKVTELKPDKLDERKTNDRRRNNGQMRRVRMAEMKNFCRDCSLSDKMLKREKIHV